MIPKQVPPDSETTNDGNPHAFVVWNYFQSSDGLLCYCFQLDEALGMSHIWPWNDISEPDTAQVELGLS